MKRDIDLIRKILWEVEKKDSPRGWLSLHIEEYSEQVISYHVKLLAEAGYLEAVNLSTKDSFEWRPISLTWEGHDFLDAARDDTVWKKAMKHIGNKILSASFEVIKALLISIAKEELGL